MWKLLIFTLSLRIKKYFNCMLYFFVSLVLYKYRKKALNKIQQIQLIQIPNFRKTLIFNYSCLPKRQATKIPILIYGNPKFAGLNGNIEIVGEVKFGMIKWGWDIGYRTTGNGIIRIDGILKLKNCKEGFIHKGVDLNLDKKAILELGNNFWFGENVMIFCIHRIVMGDNVRITYQSQVLDTDFHYTINLKNKSIKPRFEKIEIGSNIWIGNRCTIKKGSVIPDNTIIAASYSVLCKNYSEIPPYSILGGCPAKVIASGIARTYGKDTLSEIEKLDLRFLDGNDKKYFSR